MASVIEEKKHLPFNYSIKASCINQKLNPSALPIGIPKEYNSVTKLCISKDYALTIFLTIPLTSEKIWPENLNENIKRTPIRPYWKNSGGKRRWLQLLKRKKKLALQLLINTNKGFMYETKTETICFTNRNCWTNPWKISLPSAKLWPEKLKNNIGTSRIPVGRANGFSYQKTKQRTYILRTEVSWSYNALFFDTKSWKLLMKNVKCSEILQ